MNSSAEEMVAVALVLVAFLAICFLLGWLTGSVISLKRAVSSLLSSRDDGKKKPVSDEKR